LNNAEKAMSHVKDFMAEFASSSEPVTDDVKKKYGALMDAYIDEWNKIEQEYK